MGLWSSVWKTRRSLGVAAQMASNAYLRLTWYTDLISLWVCFRKRHVMIVHRVIIRPVPFPNFITIMNYVNSIHGTRGYHKSFLFWSKQPFFSRFNRNFISDMALSPVFEQSRDLRGEKKSQRDILYHFHPLLHQKLSFWQRHVQSVTKINKKLCVSFLCLCQSNTLSSLCRSINWCVYA